jgi:bifunctional UDP-N-acetylglucosamine pyrophosphorylase/glucosamine-1-phosphate N-acetyltransferase
MRHTNTVAVILAAGQGKRMKSELPKVLQEINGKALIEFVIETARSLGVLKVCVVIGYQGGLVQYRLKSRGLEFVWQREQLGTGHAVLQTRPFLEHFKGKLLIMCGDMPLVSVNSLEKLISALDDDDKAVSAAVLTGELDDPQEYGRIVRAKDGSVEKIVEAKDATPKEKKIKEVSSGTFCFEAKALFPILEKLTADNVQGEYYLTEVVTILREQGKKTMAVQAESAEELMGINSEEDLKALREIWTNKLAGSTVLSDEPTEES